MIFLACFKSFWRRRMPQNSDFQPCSGIRSWFSTSGLPSLSPWFDCVISELSPLRKMASISIEMQPLSSRNLNPNPPLRNCSRHKSQQEAFHNKRYASFWSPERQRDLRNRWREKPPRIAQLKKMATSHSPSPRSPDSGSQATLNSASPIFSVSPQSSSLSSPLEDNSKLAGGCIEARAKWVQGRSIALKSKIRFKTK